MTCVREERSGPRMCSYPRAAVPAPGATGAITGRPARRPWRRREGLEQAGGVAADAALSKPAVLLHGGVEGDSHQGGSVASRP